MHLISSAETLSAPSLIWDDLLNLFSLIVVFCGKPRLRDFVNVVGIRGGSFYYGDQINFTCRKGVQPARSPPVVTCREDGRWDGEIRCGGSFKRLF